MVSFTIKEPRTIVLFVTFRCNASCVKCCNGCRPDFGKTMTLDQMKRYVDLCLEAYPNSIKHLSLTGGEPFLIGNDLDEIVKYGKDKGLDVGIISNGYWGKKYKSALERIKYLKSIGLTAIAFSSGDDHNHIIPFRWTRNAVVASARAGFKVEFRSELGMLDGVRKEIQSDSVLMKLINDQRIDHNTYMWVDFDNEEHCRRSPAQRYRIWGEPHPCRNLFQSIPISPYGDVIACCGIGLFRIPQLRLGNIEKEPVKTIYERSFQDALKVWIYSKGPEDVLQYVYDNSDIAFRTWGEGCRYCREIFSNPEIIPLLKERYDDWSKKMVLI